MKNFGTSKPKRIAYIIGIASLLVVPLFLFTNMGPAPESSKENGHALGPKHTISSPTSTRGTATKDRHALGPKHTISSPTSTRGTATKDRHALGPKHTISDPTGVRGTATKDRHAPGASQEIYTETKKQIDCSVEKFKNEEACRNILDLNSSFND